MLFLRERHRNNQMMDIMKTFLEEAATKGNAGRRPNCGGRKPRHVARPMTGPLKSGGKRPRNGKRFWKL